MERLHPMMKHGNCIEVYNNSYTYLFVAKLYSRYISVCCSIISQIFICLLQHYIPNIYLFTTALYSKYLSICCSTIFKILISFLRHYIPDTYLLAAAPYSKYALFLLQYYIPGGCLLTVYGPRRGPILLLEHKKEEMGQSGVPTVYHVSREHHS